MSATLTTGPDVAAGENVRDAEIHRKAVGYEISKSPSQILFSPYTYPKSRGDRELDGKPPADLAGTYLRR